MEKLESADKDLPFLTNEEIANLSDSDWGKAAVYCIFRSARQVGFKNYEKLNDLEIQRYKSILILPNINFPHYEHLKVDDKVVYNCTETKLLTNEKFRRNFYFLDNYNIELDISNYVRIIINREIKIPLVSKNTFKHGLTIYINKDWANKSIHRLVKETHDPINDMEKLEVHHINNNANDNRLENLLWVTKEDHRKIDSEFNIKLMEIAKNIINSKSNFAKI